MNSAMGTEGIVAHYDPDGLVAPHVLRHVDALTQVVDHVLVVSSAPLVDQARTAICERADLLERENVGYDFGSWQAGLRQVGDWSSLDRLILVNDSVVGPLQPYASIVRAAVDARAPWWGITASWQTAEHLQSYCLGFEPAALRHPRFAEFWDGLPVSVDRAEAITNGEIALSRALTEAGLVGWPYFVPDPDDERVARQRRARLGFLLVEARGLDAGLDREAAQLLAVEEAERLLHLRRTPYNPMSALWDRALDGRLPFVKIEALRDDPYLLDVDDLALAELETAFPTEFQGVREYLERIRRDAVARSRERDPVRAWRVRALKAVHFPGQWGIPPSRDQGEAVMGGQVDTTTPTAGDYGDAYYAQYLGAAYDPSEPHWQDFFGRVAARIVDLFHPTTSLDVGCAMGILVGSLRELGVDAEGIDHSAYAIARTDPRAAGHVRVMDLLREPLEGHWDVISCIEVLEHLPTGEVDSVIANLCRVTDTIVFSSTPDEFNEGTHVNVRPPSYWAGQFADHGFFRRFDIDATFLSRDAVIYQRRAVEVRSLVSEYETALWVLRRENIGTRNALLKRDRDTASMRAQMPELLAAQAEARRLDARLRRIEGSPVVRVGLAVKRGLRRLRGSKP